jgi:hypothetical protein
MMAFEKIEVGVWKPINAGDSIQGLLTKIESGIGTNNSKIYTLEVDKKPTSVWGSTVLDPLMSVAKLGNLIKIVYDGLGEAKAGHNAPKKFTVYRDESPDENAKTFIVDANEDLEKEMNK